MDNRFFVESEHLSDEAKKRKHRLETDRAARTDHMPVSYTHLTLPTIRLV